MRLVFAITIIAAVGSAAAYSAQIDPARYISQGVKSAKSAYGLGAKIVFSYAVRDDSSTPVTFKFSSAKQFDLWVMRGDEEVYRLSKNRYYAQVITYLALRPGETKTYCVEWDQRDSHGKQVGPGIYTVYAQLTPSGKAPPSTMGKVRIGLSSAALVPITIKEAIANAAQLASRKAMIIATYKGFAPDPRDPNTRPGPPVTRSDWAICDATGCMYVHGSVTLNPTKDVGTTITVVGKIAKTDKGQVYMILESATTQKGAVCPPSGG